MAGPTLGVGHCYQGGKGTTCVVPFVLCPVTRCAWATETTNFVIKRITLKFWHLAEWAKRSVLL